MSEKLPWFKFFPFDWETDESVQLMDYFEKGVYLSLLCRSWIEGSIPSDPSKAQALLKDCLSDDKQRLSVACQKCMELFRPHPENPERLIHWRMEEQREELKTLRESRRKAGSKGGKQSSSKAQAKPKQSSSEPEPEPEPYNCSSSSGTIGRAREGEAESPSLEQAKQFAEMQAIPAPLVESWYSKNEMKHWEILATGNRWEKALMAYWKAIPPKAQAEWRQDPSTDRKNNPQIDRASGRPKIQL